jgi:hypothetical protein
MRNTEEVYPDQPSSQDPSKDTRIPWPDPLDDAPWPSPYRAFSDPCTEVEPRLPRRTVMDFAKVITTWFLADDQSLAQDYGTFAELFQSEATTSNLYGEYRDVLRARLREPKKGDAKSILLDVVNEHDMANLHRATWLRLYRALSCMININLHGDWGDPPAGGTSQGREGYDASGERSFHTTPNGYGSFAISTLDFPPPDLGIGEAAAGATEDPIEGDQVPPERIKPIARALGRALTDPTNGDGYLRVVKSFYRDRMNHTSAPGDRTLSYADVIGKILKNAKSVVELPQPLSDDAFADIHRGTWLFLAHRFYFLVGKKAFGEFVDVHERTRWVKLVVQKDLPEEHIFEVPNRRGAFIVNLRDIDPDEDRQRSW